MKTSSLIVFASTLTAFGASSLSPEAKRDIELQPSVVQLQVSFEATLGPFRCPAPVMMLGSGFLYRPDGYLITNGHVAQIARVGDSKADAERAKDATDCLQRTVLETEQRRLGRQFDTEAQGILRAQVEKAIQSGGVRAKNLSVRVWLQNRTNYQGEIKAYSDPITQGGKDIAIIKIDAKNLPTVELGSSDGVRVGDPITVIGYPGRAITSESSLLIPTVTNGRISAAKQDYKGTPVLQSEATINHGNSGGPAFDSSGRVIGIATYAATEASNLNFFVPVEIALEFVRQAGAAPERGPFDKPWHDALEAFAVGRWSNAHDLLGTVLEIMPDEPDAKKLQMQATQNMPTNPILKLVDKWGLPLILSSVVGLVLIAGILAWAVRKPGANSGATVSETAKSTAGQGSPPYPSPVKTSTVLPESFGSLQVSNGPLAGNRFVIPKAGLMIGRDPSSCAVVLQDTGVSKQHVWVVPLDNGVAVIDRDSVNGTYVNSTESPRINKVVLRDGDRIFVGKKSPTEIMYFSS